MNKVSHDFLLSMVYSLIHGWAGEIFSYLQIHVTISFDVMYGHE